MVYIVLVDARKTSLTGVQNSPKKSARRFAARKIAKKNRLAASRLVKKKKKKNRTMGQTPPLGKKLDPPLELVLWEYEDSVELFVINV